MTCTIEGILFTFCDITTNKQANDMLALFNNLQPEIGSFDTETTGLHIINDRPFLYQFGFLNREMTEGFTYAVDLQRYPLLGRIVINAWQHCAAKLKIYLGHNVKYDLHMIQNIGLPYTTENISDSMFYIRYAHDAIATKHGGVPLKLKAYATQYIYRGAKHIENQVEILRAEIANNLNARLLQRLRMCGKPPAEYGAKSYTKKFVTDLLKDCIADYTVLPTEEAQQAYLDWVRLDVPLYLQNKVRTFVDIDDIPYDKVDRATVIKYGHYDIVYPLCIYKKLAPIVTNRGNDVALEIENKAIYPLWEMERVGFKIDKPYLETSRVNMKTYIIRRRQRFYELAGQQISTGQSVLIMQIFADKYHVEVPSTGKEELELLYDNLCAENTEHPALEFIRILQELRTLEKWYSTYIIRWQKNLHDTDRLYTTINQVATVSGRVSSDFQQFPTKYILDDDNNVLFEPRRMILVSGEDYDGIVYLDYSQIELRFQALYTILVGSPDRNLCRAYLPYECVDAEGVVFDYKNPEIVKLWNKKDWFLKEDTSALWTPTDVHGVTTTAATGLKPGDEGFSNARKKIGKKVNFAKNYGAKRKRIRSMFPHATEDEITRIDDSYYTAFPGIKEYHDYCYRRAKEYSDTANLFGVHYWGVTGHKLINLLVQGSAAFFLKIRIREVYDYCKAHNIKSRFQMNIHDELSWEKYKTETDVFFEIKRIMETWDDSYVPIVADMEVTTTTWADKKEVETLEALRHCFSD